MTCHSQRTILLQLVRQACNSGARLQRACAIIGINVRTLQRWKTPQSVQGDRRRVDLRTPFTPSNKLTEAEQQEIMRVINSNEFKDISPNQIVPRLADTGRYLASESTLYRLMRQAGQLTHRTLSRKPVKRSKPLPLVATQPNAVFSWDITYLSTTVTATYFYLYLFVDVYSRKIVGWQVYDRERASFASDLLRDICERLGIPPGQLTVHSDNGAPMKGETLLATMQRLGVTPSRSRPSVSNDNPYSESLFRTLKYRPLMPIKPFEDIQIARQWVAGLVDWYNKEHRHCSIRFVTPEQRHDGMDAALLQKRISVYNAARQAKPNRWSGSIRNWSPITHVYLNPAKQQNKE